MTRYSKEQKTTRLIALARAIYTCERCGRTDKLDVHHKDENTDNNSPENLEVVCAYCHSKIHKERGKHYPLEARLIFGGAQFVKDCRIRNGLKITFNPI